MPHIPPFKEIIARSPRVFIIGVVGDSGSGKTTFTNVIRQIFGPDMVATLTLDDYHKFDREERLRLNITLLHPEANNLMQLESDVTRLKEGKAIEKPVYNHATRTFDPPVSFASKKIIILEGLHMLFSPVLRELVDFSVFVDPDHEIKYDWKRQRDIG
jgi:phosphoribulokinase